ncbi:MULTISPECIES: hypothetical protein [unclassified Cupriavidus]|uniref:hypothetical protein n=1 Tax=unclassified Cupriavidus TaxID=2640874 RepID=UPI001C000F44|nr:MULTISPECIES: hypothetical protein [unclassified Cupriavidus]MCA3187960.1 hypothetical protein [Cupriavidus sp.]MCA3192351.1 hypothetical protein [Cupriavidus sp.]MCA3196126.1 hypothetical protein [Cupriavidus sp.]MCA3203659.1 hypothetical protein [Cupriavidus sp.]MCA3206255.1 hypothetical protein [Cupriavidus sp.]
MATREDASTRNSPTDVGESDHRDETLEVKVSGDGNGLVDDETSGHVLKPDDPAPGKTANEQRAGEGDEDATSQ